MNGGIRVMIPDGFQERQREDEIADLIQVNDANPVIGHPLILQEEIIVHHL
jgi:hypothetical protein